MVIKSLNGFGTFPLNGSFEYLAMEEYIINNHNTIFIELRKYQIIIVDITSFICVHKYEVPFFI